MCTLSESDVQLPQQPVTSRSISESLSRKSINTYPLHPNEEDAIAESATTG
jgi:hypothetical protein